jgi:hypothetical protein
VAKLLGRVWVVARRFGIRQGAKTRSIDDFSEFLINSAFGCSEKVDCAGIDDICLVVRCLMEALNAGDELVLELSDGTCLRGRRHAFWAAKEHRQLAGRLLDLKSAYKQLARRSTQSWATVIGVKNPTSGLVEFFSQSTLAFGQSGAVLGFNRMAKALRIVAVRLFGLLVCNYYDDFTQVETETLATTAQQTLEGLMRMLGWTIAEDARKRLPFARSFEPLGVVIDLSRSTDMAVIVRNKESRVVNTLALVANILEAGCMEPHAAASLRGIILFMEQQIFGRCGAIATRTLVKKSDVENVGWKLSAFDKKLLEWLPRYFRLAPERVIRFGTGCEPVIICTDGAFEKGVATIGGTIVDGEFRQAFGCTLPDMLVSRWTKERNVAQCIGQVELFPVWVARALWGLHLRGRRVLWLIDNESARFALIAMSSPVAASADILWSIADLEISLQTLSWYERVPTASNLADGPSRLCFEDVLALGFVVVNAVSVMSSFGTASSELASSRVSH